MTATFAIALGAAGVSTCLGPYEMKIGTFCVPIFIVRTGMKPALKIR